MHFSIPETKEIKHGFKTFITYLIYINGSFHCSLRYRQLYHFHLQLKKQFGTNFLPDFPPKKFLPLNSQQIEERKLQLEKYIQIVSQDSQIINSDLFNGFLLAAQQETHNDSINSVQSNDDIDIYQLDWQPIHLITNDHENSEILLRKLCQTLQIDKKYVPYFALYLVERLIDANNALTSDYRLIRRLQNFESPLLTLRTLMKQAALNNSNNYVIIIRKSYFDIQFDLDLFDNDITLNCIYLQTINDIENGHIICKDNNTKKHLNQLKITDNKLEYIQLARLQKFYGYLHFDPCYCDLPSSPSSTAEAPLSTSKTSVKLFAGNQELIIQTNDDNKDEYSFRVIRIKCWRLTTSSSSSHNRSDNDHQRSKDESKGRFEISFEYLINKGCLQWITIYSSQAVLISYCLQSMVEEMLLKREGKKFRSEGLNIRYNTSPNSRFMNNHQQQQNQQQQQTDHHHSSNVSNANANSNGLTSNTVDNNIIEWNYYKQDGTQHYHYPLSTSSSTTTLTSEKSQNSEKSFINDNYNSMNHQIDSSQQQQQQSQKMNDLSERFREISLVENNVFNEIGDDDL